jgi:hypothetical protein
MKPCKPFHNHVVASFFAIALAFPAGAQTLEEQALDEMFTQLQTAEGPAASRLERKIWREWSKSGSPTMDLLLQRGRDSMSAG